ncbi:MAG: hypothetical protein NVSMB44_25610 [Ktedonobacteraceae bacterium]
MAMSQSAQFGPLLTNEEQYRKEISALPRLSNEEEWMLIERARSGEKQAAHDLVCGVLASVVPLAWRYARLARATDFLEFCQIASLAMLETVASALQKEQPGSYLYGVARSAMREHRMMRDDLVVKKAWSDASKESCVTVSLDVPLSEDGGETYVDVLEAPCFVGSVKDETVYAPLYEAIDCLTEKQRIAITRGFGIGENPRLPTAEIEYELTGGKMTGNAYCKKGDTPIYNQRRRDGLKQLRKRLERSGYLCA